MQAKDDPRGTPSPASAREGRAFPADPPGVAALFLLLAAGLTALHRPGILTAVVASAPRGDGLIARIACLQTRIFAEALAAAEGTLVATLPCLGLIALRRWPRVAVPATAVAIALLVLAVYVDTKVLCFFGSDQILVESLRAEGVLAHAGIPRASVAVLAGATLACSGLAFACLGVWLAHPSAHVERGAAWLSVPLLALALAVTSWTRFTRELGHDERKVRSRSLVGSGWNDAVRSADHHPWRPLRYPRAVYSPAVHPRERPDILLVVVESLQASALAPETMPLTFAASARGLRALRHYSGGNCTQLAIFSLLYGTNTATYGSITGENIPSYPLTWLKEQGYRLLVYSGQSLRWEHMDRLLFHVFDEIHQPPTEEFTTEQDDAAALAATNAFTAADGPPRLVMLVLNATHFDYEYPAEFERFRPASADLNVLGTVDDPRPLFNRYLNAVAYADWQIERVLAAARARARGRPLVVVTGDHGEEFLEHGYITHASNLFDPQTHVPLVVWGLPDLPPGTTLDRVTGHQDVLPTLLHAIAPDLDLSVSGTGIPLEDDRPAPRLASQCRKDDFVSVSPSGKTWFSIRSDGVVVWSETGLSDDAPPAGTSAPPNTPAILDALAYLGGSGVQPAEWSCPRFDVRGATFHWCDAPVRRDEADAICARHGSRLAWFDSAEQYDDLARSPQGARGAIWPTAVWIGLSRRDRQGPFVWSTGGSPGFARWGEGQPSARLLDDCVLAGDASGRPWRSVRCAGETGFAEAGFLCRQVP